VKKDWKEKHILELHKTLSRQAPQGDEKKKQTGHLKGTTHQLWEGKVNKKRGSTLTVKSLVKVGRLMRRAGLHGKGT